VGVTKGAINMRLTDFKALTFDCYGTLIDWETGMVEALKPLAARAKAPLTRNAILEAHARHESAQQLQTPGKVYRELLAIVYKRLAEEWGVAASWEDCRNYGLSIRQWPAFPDSAGALQYLKKHYKLVILSNVDNESFGFSNQKLGSLNVSKEAVLHTAESMFHDHKPANDVGLKSCWIYRRHADQGFGATMHPGDMPHYDFRFTSMAELARAHQLIAPSS